MSSLAFTFLSDSLADRIVDIECDGRIGDALAGALAERGARLRLHGRDSASLRALQAAIARRWGRAELAGASACGDAHQIRFLTSPQALLAGIDAADRAAARPDIAIFTGDLPREIIDPALAKAADEGRQVRVIVFTPASGHDASDAALDALAGLVIFLLSAAGADIPNQCFHVAETSAARPARRAVPTAIPACAPAWAD